MTYNKITEEPPKHFQQIFYYKYRRMVLLLFRVVAERKMIAIQTCWQWRGRQGSTHQLYVESTMDFTVSTILNWEQKQQTFLQGTVFLVYVEMGFADSDMVTIDINLANEESAAKFNILVSQIPCTASYRYITHILTVVFIYLDVLDNIQLLKYAALTIFLQDNIYNEDIS
jgi:hypothetical protein